MIRFVNYDALEKTNSEKSLFGAAFIAGLPYIVQTCLAVLCIFKADAIVRFIADKTNAKWPKILAITLLALGAFIVVLSLIYMAYYK